MAEIVIPVVVVTISAVASVIAARVANLTRQENTEQHAQSQQLLSDLRDEVKTTGKKIDVVATRLDGVVQRVDDAHHRIDHKPRRRWFR
jgi:uncharacterized protein YnzC (UPF0291/DUF896 family)